MMTTQKRKPPAAGRGRRKGELNKFTRSVRDALAEAFDRLGGVESLVKWGKKNPTEFYKLWGRTAPPDQRSGLAVNINMPAPGATVTSADDVARLYAAALSDLTIDIGSLSIGPQTPLPAPPPAQPEVRDPPKAITRMGELWAKLGARE